MVKNNPSNKFNKTFNISLVVLCIILVIIGKLDLVAYRNVSSFLTDFFAPISSFINKPAKELEIVIEDVKSATQLRKENLLLKHEIKRLKNIEKKSEIQESELIELKKVLNSIPRENNFLITGRVLNLSGGTFAKTMLIDAGKKDGIEKGQPVISSDGLVGSIISVGPNSSRVLLLIDINSMIPIFLTQTGWPAIVQGQNGYLLKVKFLSSEANPINNEIIETSGHGGRFPPGINVGRMVKISPSSYFVKLSADPQRLRFVSVISGSKFNSRKELPVGMAPLQNNKKWLNLKGFNKIN